MYAYVLMFPLTVYNRTRCIIHGTLSINHTNYSVEGRQNMFSDTQDMFSEPWCLFFDIEDDICSQNHPNAMISVLEPSRQNSPF